MHDVNPSPRRRQRRDTPRTKRAEATRLALVEAARKLFTEHGYHAVGVRDFAARAGVTRGALYHHFPNKEAVFLAVFNAVELDLLAEGNRLLSRSPAPEPWLRLRAGIQFYLDATIRPEIQRITLLDGPAVLGWRRWRELETGYSLGAIIRNLQGAMDAGRIRSRPIEPLAHLIFGAMMEAALLIANSEQAQARRAEVGQAMEDLLHGLETPAQPA